MTETESAMLGLILSEWVKLTLDDPAQRLGEGFYQWRRRAASIRNLDRLGVVVDPTWLGSAPAGRQARRRAMAGLVADGWVTLRVIHRRLTFVRPTDAALSAIVDGCEAQVANEPPPEPAWVLPPTPLTTAELDAALAIDPALDALLAADAASLDELLASIVTDPAIDAMLADLAATPEPPQ